MALNSDITISKGSISVTLFTAKRIENLKNVIQYLPPIQAASNQSLGPKIPKAVDLLKITETFVFNANITPQESPTKTPKEIKEDLKSIVKGAGVDGGGPATLTYEDESISVYIDDLQIIHVNNDDVNSSSYPGYDSTEYSVTITMTKAVVVA